MDKTSLSKIVWRRFFALAIFVCLVGLIAFMAGRVFVNAFHGETNIDLLQFVQNRCQEIPIDLSEKMVVLRVDDVQAHAWTGITHRMIDDANARGITPVLGVIPRDLKSDESFYSYLRSVRCKVEVAIHGWDHSEGEFSSLAESDARERIDKGRKVLEILTRAKMYTFIPPENLVSSGTEKALHNGGLLLSSGETGKLLDFTTTTYDYRNNIPVSANVIVDSCAQAFVKTSLCIVMVHPQDFANEMGILDEHKYQNYISTLDALKHNGASFVTFKYLLQHKWKSKQGVIVSY